MDCKLGWFGCVKTCFGCVGRKPSCSTAIRLENHKIWEDMRGLSDSAKFHDGVSPSSNLSSSPLETPIFSAPQTQLLFRNDHSNRGVSAVSLLHEASVFPFQQRSPKLTPRELSSIPAEGTGFAKKRRRSFRKMTKWWSLIQMKSCESMCIVTNMG